jgi:hypothetical protein
MSIHAGQSGPETKHQVEGVHEGFIWVELGVPTVAPGAAHAPVDVRIRKVRKITIILTPPQELVRHSFIAVAIARELTRPTKVFRTIFFETRKA